ncbi:MAG: ral secretion pathway protein GspF [Verrucomicrobiaceae bacterium]|nr:ral secretion pathway protein GspF [Verrucomicrobiaceae bacterium]
MTKRNSFLHPDAPLLLNNHRRPRTRREFIAQSFAAGSGAVIASSLFGLFPNAAQAALSGDLAAQMTACSAGNGASGMLPFLCFDLAGGGNIAGSNVLVGFKGGQQDLLSTSGYSLLGLPAGMAPNAPGAATAALIDTSLGLTFHADSAFLRGIKMTLSPEAMANINGAVIPARSENDTGNNPHNPMYGIYRAGARGSLVNLIGSQNSDSGGNSMAPAMLIDVSARPTQVNRPSDVTGLVGTSTDLPRILVQDDTVAAMESVARISNLGVNAAGAYYPTTPDYTAVRESAKCEIVKSADSTDRFGATSPDPTKDAAITSIFTSSGGLMSDGEFLKTASIMKLVVGLAGTSHYAAAGTITMGGFDYHTGNRSSGEGRDFRAGQCMGACLEYAHRMQTPLMLYVFSDGSVSSNGGMDSSMAGRGKNNWDTDNQATGAAFFLVYKPGSGVRPALRSAASQQIGWMRMDGSVDTAGSPAANSVTQLVDTVVLNYLALQGKQSLLSQALAGRAEASILGGAANWDKYTAFQPIM